MLIIYTITILKDINNNHIKRYKQVGDAVANILYT